MKARLRIREIAQSKGMSRTKLQIQSEVAYGTIRKVFRDPYTEITITTLSRLAHAMGVETRDAMEDVEDSVYEAEAREIRAKRKASSEE